MTDTLTDILTLYELLNALSELCGAQRTSIKYSDHFFVSIQLKSLAKDLNNENNQVQSRFTSSFVSEL